MENDGWTLEQVLLKTIVMSGTQSWYVACPTGHQYDYMLNADLGDFSGSECRISRNLENSGKAKITFANGNNRGIVYLAVNIVT